MIDMPLVALLTPRSPSGVAVILLTGIGSEGLLARFFRRARTDRPPLPADSRAAYGFIERAGRLLDEVLVVCTSTAPPAYEICCHGGSAPASSILELLTSYGAQATSWDRLLQKKTLDHDLLTDLLRGEGGNQAAVIAHLLGGTLREKLQKLVGALLVLRSEEHKTDDGTVPSALKSAIRLEESYSVGRFLHSSPRVVIHGPANAGKSTLFNALLDEHRALTSKTPGTTRDPVEAGLLLDGFPVRLFDLPGEQSCSGSELMRKAFQVAGHLKRDGDLFIFVVDCREAESFASFSKSHERPTNEKKRLIIVHNKVDLMKRGKEIQPASFSMSRGAMSVNVSALNRVGLEPLLEKMALSLGLRKLVVREEPVLVNRRQLAMVRRARKALETLTPDSRLCSRLDSYLYPCPMTHP